LRFRRASRAHGRPAPPAGATRWDLQRALRISVPGFVILKTLVSAGFAVSAVKRDLDRSVIRFVVAQPF
jgi:hypothetical protein